MRRGHVNSHLCRAWIMGFLGSTPMNGSGGWAALSSIPIKDIPGQRSRVNRDNDAGEAWPARGVSEPSRLHYFFRTAPSSNPASWPGIGSFGENQYVLSLQNTEMNFSLSLFFLGIPGKSRKFLSADLPVEGLFKETKTVRSWMELACWLIDGVDRGRRVPRGDFPGGISSAWPRQGGSSTIVIG
jgi:hypothetical protein